MSALTKSDEDDASNNNIDTFQSYKYAVNLIEHKTYLPINFADRIWMASGCGEMRNERGYRVTDYTNTGVPVYYCTVTVIVHIP